MKRRRTDDDRPPRLVLLPAAVAPLVLVGGWNLASSAQPDSYDGLRDTLSSLAAIGTPHREIMTAAFVVMGLAYLATAALLRLASGRGRQLLAVGGLATLAVGLLPLSTDSDGTAHAVAAVVAFVSLALWSALAGRPDGPPVLHPTVMRLASGVLALLVVWLGVALVTDVLVGLAERVAALAEALWPLVVAWMVREWGGGGGTRHEEPPADPTVDPPLDPHPEDQRPNDRPSEPVDGSPADEPAGSGRR